MFDHISIGVRDISKAKAFYDAALKPLGLTCLSADKTSLGYGKEAPRFWVNAAEQPVRDDPKSGLHFCFTAPSRQSVEAFHNSPVTMSVFDQGISGAMMTSIAVSPSMAKMTATFSVESD